ncbi:hypothetical protein RJT34_12759 [Clitoria ternatea]|uniref:Uncharacterized protein n=1 Tax=Clitoria ternatea TaxID=43366 RepID=A0AAN9JQF6_CLITE
MVSMKSKERIMVSVKSEDDNLDKIGGFREGIPIDPKRKVNMEKKDVSFAKNIPDEELETEVEKLKQQILETKESFYGTPKLDLDEMIKKLERDVHRDTLRQLKPWA